MRINELTLGDGVPATYLSADADAPMVLFSNGFGAPRGEGVPPGVPENPISPPLVSGLLNAGYSVLIPENPGHGERLAVGDSTAAALRRGFLAEGPDLVQRTVNETQGLISEAVARGLVPSAERVGVLGHSWGAFQAILRLTGDGRIACGVGLIPVIEPRCLEPFIDITSAPGLDDVPLTSRAIDGIQGRPLLLIASTNDDVAPARLVREFVTEVNRTDPGCPVSYLELAGVGHHYDPRHLEETLRWLGRHLRHQTRTPEALHSAPSTTGSAHA